MDQRIFQGTWCDIARQGTGVLHVTSLPNGEVHYRSAAALDGHPIVHKLGRSLLYLRADGTTNGHILVIGKDQVNGHAYFAIDGGTATDMGPCHGIHCVEVVGQDDTWDIWIVRIGRVDHYEINQFGTHELIDQRPTNTTQGFLSGSELADVGRDSVPGLVYPFSAGFYAVGQNGGPDPARLRVYQGGNGNLCACYVGYAQRPNAAFLNGRLYVAAYVGGGALFQSWDPAELAWGNDAVVAPPPPPPPPPPDQPFVIDPNGVIEDIALWLFSTNQGPDVHISPDGLVRFFCKSDESSGDGRDPHIGEHWDLSPTDIGHLDDASTGQRVFEGKRVTAEEIVARFPQDHARIWASLPLNHNWFKDGARLWMPRRLKSGTVIKYRTDISWTDGKVWSNVPITITIDVGFGRINGKEVRARVIYGPGNDQEINYYGPPNGYNAWIAGPFPRGGDPHLAVTR